MFDKIMLGSVCLFLLIIPEVWSADTQGTIVDKKGGYSREPERIYGWQLMLPAERQAYQQKMRNLRTKEARQAYKQKHMVRMQQRAKDKGVDLKDLEK